MKWQRRERRRFLPFLELLEERALLAADLQGQALLAPDTAAWGSAISVQSQVRNADTPGTGAFQVRWYLSADAVGSTNDILLSRTNNQGNSYTHSGLAAGASGPTFSVNLQLPTAPPSGFTGGLLYVIMRVDGANQIVESNENNNFGQLGDGIDREAITITSPEIAVLFGAQNIVDGDTSPSAAEGTAFGSVVQGSAPVTRVFTVRNDGTGPLTLGAISLPTGYSLAEGLSASLAAGASDTFTVQLDTAASGVKSGTINIVNNDANENPFNFNVSGTVTASSNVPEVAVQFGTVIIVDNDTSPATSDGTDFGNAVVGGTPVSRVFTVRNTGVATLTLGTLTMTSPGFTITEGLPASLAAGASDTFTVQLDTVTGGTKTTQISFTNNDGNESPFNFTIRGVVTTAPEVSVLFGTTHLTDGDNSPSAAEGTDFGNPPVGSAPVTRTFTVRNDGSATLTLGAPLIPSGFTLTDGLPSSLAPGASDTFTIQLNTTTAGARSGQISFATNDVGESPFNFSISGNVTVPEVTVEFAGTGILDNDSSPILGDGTNFGTAIVNMATVSHTFTVRNDGGAPLVLGAVSVPTGFTLTEGLTGTLAPGASDTFTVRMDTTVVGTKMGQISFTTNDAGESPFNFTITGVVSAGTIDLAGVDLQAPTSTQWGRAVTVQAQIHNSGTGVAGPFSVEWYLSQDVNGSTSSDVLLSRTNGNGTSYTHSSIAAGSSGAAFNVELQLPSTPPSGFTGTNFHIIMRVDAAGAISETSETNNFGQVGEGSDRVAVSILATDTFTRHSLPGATKVIYLDFDSHTTTDSAWNSGNTFFTPRYDSDNNTGSFSATELAAIEAMWAKVAEDFLPFEVDVTTEDPGIEGLRNTGGGDTQWGIRVVIGGTGSWGPGGGGIAQLFSFDANRDIPCFVFSDNFGDFGPNIAEAISHEVGHTLGLNHDGRISPAEEYFGGHGAAPNRWGAIMGTAYNRDISQWSRGEYTSATNTQDDLAIITTGNGFTYRVDDHASTSAGATNLTPLSSTSLEAEGIIERNTDVDFFTFTLTTPGTVTIDVSPAAIGANLDILARLFDSSLVEIDSDNPSAALSASIVQTLAAGTYYLSIDGVGFGNPATDGYSDYASLGYFSIAVSATGGGAFSTAAPIPAAAPPLAEAQASEPGALGGASATMATDAGFAAPPWAEFDRIVTARFASAIAARHRFGAGNPPQPRLINTVAEHVPAQPHTATPWAAHRAAWDDSPAFPAHGDVADAALRDWPSHFVEVLA